MITLQRRLPNATTEGGLNNPMQQAAVRLEELPLNKTVTRSPIAAAGLAIPSAEK